MIIAVNFHGQCERLENVVSVGMKHSSIHELSTTSSLKLYLQAVLFTGDYGP